MGGKLGAIVQCVYLTAPSTLVPRERQWVHKKTTPDPGD